MTPAFAFVLCGGAIRTDGLEIVTQCNDSPDPELQVGEEIFVFVSRYSENGPLYPSFGSYGILRVRGSEVIPTNKTSPLARPPYVTVNFMVSEIQRLVALPPKPRLR
jgi:hypothetical protein